MIIKNGFEITSVGTTEVELEFDGLEVPKGKQHIHTAYIDVDITNSGTIQFSSGAPITASHAAWPAGARVIMSFVNGKSSVDSSDLVNLRYKASAVGQKFKITV